MNKRTDILVYEWEAWDGFLISHLIADYCRMPANYDDPAAHFERYLSPNIKAVLLQINLSQQIAYPKARQAIIQYLKQQQLKVLNEHIVDITKSNLHQLLINAGINTTKADFNDANDTPLFVKSNLNWGGEVEQRLAPEIRQQLFGQQDRTITAFDQYYLTSKAEIEPHLWQDSSVVIEKYITNDEGSFYRVYGFGTTFVIVKAYAEGPIKKINGDHRDHNHYYYKTDLEHMKPGLPQNLQKLILKFSNKINIDYFCLDIVHDTENFYIVDLNTTPYSGTQEQTSAACEFLCQGARALLQ